MVVGDHLQQVDRQVPKYADNRQTALKCSFFLQMCAPKSWILLIVISGINVSHRGEAFSGDFLFYFEMLTSSHLPDSSLIPDWFHLLPSKDLLYIVCVFPGPVLEWSDLLCTASHDLVFMLKWCVCAAFVCPVRCLRRERSLSWEGFPKCWGALRLWEFFC